MESFFPKKIRQPAAQAATEVDPCITVEDYYASDDDETQLIPQDTIFDVIFHPEDPESLATPSYDEYAKVDTEDPRSSSMDVKQGHRRSLVRSMIADAKTVRKTGSLLIVLGFCIVGVLAVGYYRKVSHIGIVAMYSIGQSNYTVRTCPPNYPICSLDADCVIDGAQPPWIRAALPQNDPGLGGYNYIDGYDGLGANCSWSYHQATACPLHYPVCSPDKDCVIHGAQPPWFRAALPQTDPGRGGYNYIDGYDGLGTNCLSDYQQAASIVLLPTRDPLLAASPQVTTAAPAIIPQATTTTTAGGEGDDTGNGQFTTTPKTQHETNAIEGEPEGEETSSTTTPQESDTNIGIKHNCKGSGNNITIICQINVGDHNTVHDWIIEANTSTTLSKPAKAGDRKLEVAKTHGFVVGLHVIIDLGTPSEESNAIRAFGSMILQLPLKHDHDVGAKIYEAYPQKTTCTANGCRRGHYCDIKSGLCKACSYGCKVCRGPSCDVCSSGMRKITNTTPSTCADVQASKPPDRTILIIASVVAVVAIFAVCWYCCKNGSHDYALLHADILDLKQHLIDQNEKCANALDDLRQALKDAEDAKDAQRNAEAAAKVIEEKAAEVIKVVQEEAAIIADQEEVKKANDARKKAQQDEKDAQETLKEKEAALKQAVSEKDRLAKELRRLAKKRNLTEEVEGLEDLLRREGADVPLFADASGEVLQADPEQALWKHASAHPAAKACCTIH